jgi:hypothetical protein
VPVAPVKAVSVIAASYAKLYTITAMYVMEVIWNKHASNVRNRF